MKCFVSCLILLNILQTAVALQCYQCVSTKEGSPCESDVDMLMNARNQGGTFSKNCSIERNHQQYCVIEKSSNRGHLSTLIRDCSDGKTFSFDKIPILHNLAPTNQTTCSSYGNSATVVCISICKTDFCNGPQTSAAQPRYDVICVVYTVLFYVLRLIS